MAVKPKILVVDDEPLLCEILSFDLTEAGFDVIPASGGNEALAILAEQPVDVVVTDIRMPKGNGIELLDKIKLRAYATPVVLFVSGFADITLEEAYDKGADAVFSKPCAPEALVKAIRQGLMRQEERWLLRGEPSQVHGEVELELGPFAAAIADKKLNIGRGGMFLKMDGHLPQAGQVLRLRVAFTDWPTIAGLGIVRWSRKTRGVDQAGLGIEFVELEPTTCQKISEYVAHLQAPAFIPKS